MRAAVRRAQFDPDSPSQRRASFTRCGRDAARHDFPRAHEEVTTPVLVLMKDVL